MTSKLFFVKNFFNHLKTKEIKIININPRKKKVSEGTNRTLFF